MQYCAIDEVENLQTTSIDVPGAIAGGNVDDPACGTGPAATRRRAFDSPLAFQMSQMNKRHYDMKDEETSTHWRAVVRLRIPRDSNRHLTTAVARRLEVPASVVDVDDVTLMKLEPHLNATEVQVKCTLVTHCVRKMELRNDIETGPALTQVDELDAMSKSQSSGAVLPP